MTGPESYKYSRFTRPKQETRWADLQEIKDDAAYVPLAAESYKAAGLPVINNGVEAWVDDSDTHSLVFGSTGSKKTRLFCMPMLNVMIGAGESFIATDPKGELYARTAGFAREKGYQVVVLNYRDLTLGDTWNPLALPYELYHSGNTEDAVARLNDFVSAISQDAAERSKDAFWVNAAKSVALAILMLMMDMCTREECNLRTFTRFCVEFGKGTSDKLTLLQMGALSEEVEPNYLEKIMERAPADSIAHLNYYGIASSNDRARGDVQSTLFTLVQIFMTQESLVANMARSSFDVRDAGEKKMAVYLIVPDEKTTYHFIATTFVKQSYESLIQKAQGLENRQLPVRVNFVLDEFANIPTIPDMPAMITAARSRNMRFYLVIQSMHQLTKRYGEEAQTIKGNCDNWVFLTSKELSLLQEISALCGNYTPAVGGGDKPLISVSQLQRLSKERGEALIFHRRQYPFISELADIDDCVFAKLAPPEMKKVNSKKLVSVDPEKVFTEMQRRKRPLPFAQKKSVW